MRMSFLLQLSTFLAIGALVKPGQAGFYADNGLDQTISYRSLPTSEKREMENEILNLLGLDHRPKPKLHQTKNSAPQYLIDLYNHLDMDADDRNTSLRDVDFVVSFVNHHDNKEDELSIEPKLRFDVTDISPYETVLRAELNLYRKNTRKATFSPASVQPANEHNAAQHSSTISTNEEAAPTGSTSSTGSSGSTSSTGSTYSTGSTSSTRSTSSIDSTSYSTDVTGATASTRSARSTIATADNVSQGDTFNSTVLTADPPINEKVTIYSELLDEENQAKRESTSFDYLDDYLFYDQAFQLQVLSMRTSTVKKSEFILESVANYSVTANETGWIRLNATGALLNWVAFPSENFGLVVRLVDTESGLQLSPSQAGLVMARAGEFAPFMAAFIKEGAGAKRRSTRASEKTRRDKPPLRSFNDDGPYFEIRHHFSRRNACQKRTLYVSFRDLGWQDWIIAPDGYSAFYCDGECSFPLNVNATNHAIVQTLVHLVSPGHAPKACCAPTKLAPIMVLYFDDNSNVILKKYKNMVVRSCGCH